jgi:hypothetical protein
MKKIFLVLSIVVFSVATVAFAFEKFDCVQWEVSYSTNPYFDADYCTYSITGHVVDSGQGQCEVKVKSQERTSFIYGAPPYRNGQTIIIECSKLSTCTK